MRANIQQVIAAQPSQHTNEWYKNRLGHFTGSQVGRLMKKGRGKDAEWSADAIAYIKEVVAERLLSPVAIDVQDYFEEYLDLTIATSKVMAYGTDNEGNALKAYTFITGREVTHCGSLPHESVASFWDSPDGILLEDDGVVEVKCPLPKTHALYLMNARTPDELLTLKPEYYWQAISHMAVTGASFCDWMSYCKFMRPALHIVHFERDKAVISQLLERIQKADEMAEQFIAEIRQKHNSGSVS